VILYYDYFLTLPREVEHIWKNWKKMTTFFYVFCRYALVANTIYLFYRTEGIKLEKLSARLRSQRVNVCCSCQAVRSVSGVLAIFGHVGILAVWGLRTLAIYERNKIVKYTLGTVGVSTLIARIVSPAHRFLEAIADSKSCWASLSEVGISVAVLMILFEALAFVLAAARAWKTVRQDVNFWKNPRASLNYVIFSQGLMYISAVFALSIMTAIANLGIWGETARPLNSFKLPLSGLLTARFLLELRTWNRRTDDTSSSHHITSVSKFAVVTGSSQEGSNYTTSSGDITVSSRPITEGGTLELRLDGMSFAESIFRELGGDIGPLPLLEPEGATGKRWLGAGKLESVPEVNEKDGVIESSRDVNQEKVG
ncbi:hypothetical protein FA15DRAFT_594006, partial [Coprinopsis marcescibilis]